MSTLTGRSVQKTYKDLLKIEAAGDGLPTDVTQLKTIQDGNGNSTPVQIGRELFNIQSGFMLGGTLIVATAEHINLLPGLLDEIYGGDF